jgi:hypothetical protein
MFHERRILVGSAGACLDRICQLCTLELNFRIGRLPIRRTPFLMIGLQSSEVSRRSHQHAHRPGLLETEFFAGHRSAARTAMPDPQLGIWVDEALRVGPKWRNDKTRG